MARISNCCTFASLVAVVVLVLLPVRSWCKEDTSGLHTQPECCGSAAAGVKRFDDIDYDTFVSLMGRRSAAQPNRQMDHMLAALLGQRPMVKCMKLQAPIISGMCCIEEVSLPQITPPGQTTSSRSFWEWLVPVLRGIHRRGETDSSMTGGRGFNALCSGDVTPPQPAHELLILQALAAMINPPSYCVNKEQRIRDV